MRSRWLAPGEDRKKKAAWGVAYTAKVPEFLWVWCGSQEREPDLLILRRNPAKGNTWMDEMTSVEGRILETKRPVQASCVTREDMAHKGTAAERSPERKYWAIKKEATLESAAPRGHELQLLSPPSLLSLAATAAGTASKQARGGEKQNWHWPWSPFSSHFQAGGGEKC